MEDKAFAENPLEAGGKVCPHCLHSMKERSEKEKRSMINRLNRIEGQVRGIRKMVENNAYCPEILIRCPPSTRRSTALIKCFWPNISVPVWRRTSGRKEETIDELVLVLQKLMK